MKELLATAGIFLVVSGLFSGCGDSGPDSKTAPAPAGSELKTLFVGDPPPGPSGGDLGTCDASSDVGGPAAENQLTVVADCDSAKRPLGLEVESLNVDSEGIVRSVGGITGADVPRLSGDLSGVAACSTLNGVLACDLSQLRGRATKVRYRFVTVIQFDGDLCDRRLQVRVLVPGFRASLGSFSVPVRVPRSCD